MKRQITKYAKKENYKKNWYYIDATDLVLGRLASEVAKQVMGKNSVDYTPSVDTGDFIVIYNAEKIKLKGNKANQKMYYRHSGYPGGLKEITFKTMLDKKPEEIIRIAVKGMLPKNRLGRKMINKVKIFKGESDKHNSQNPVNLDFKSLKEKK